MARVISTAGFPQFKKLTEDEGALGVNMVVFGPPGVGKTTFALTAQDHPAAREVLLIDADKGRESVLDRDVAYTVPESWDEARGLLDTALSLKGESPYKTLVFDSISSLYAELLFRKITKSDDGKLSLPQYDEAGRVFMKFMRDAKSLCEYGINTIFIGHVEEERENIGSAAEPSYVTNVKLSLTNKLRDKVLLSVNHVGYLEYQAKGDKRVLHFRPPRRVSGPKFRQTLSGEQMPLQLENPSMADIFNHVRKDKR